MGREFMGAPLDVDAILATMPVEPEPSAAAPAPRESATAPATDRRKAFAAAVGAAWPAKGTPAGAPGRRHEAQLSLVGGVTRRGLVRSRGARVPLRCVPRRRRRKSTET